MKRIIACTLIMVFTVVLVCSCSGTSSKSVMPFTELTWSSSPEDATAYHQCEPSNTYDASIGDKAYVFENIEYDGKTGKITYFFTNEGELVSTYFDIACSDDNEVDSLYKKYIDSYTKQYGDSDFAMEEGTISGKVWYEDNGNIGVMYMKFINKMVRFQYMNPKFTENNK